MRTVQLGGDKDTDIDRARPSADDVTLWRRFKGSAGEDAKVWTLQKLKFGAPAPPQFSATLPVLAPANASRGQTLLSDIWRIGHESLTLPPGTAPWNATLPSRHFADRLHTFDWLPDLLSQGEEGISRALRFTDEWNATFGKFNGFAWRFDPLSQRVWTQFVHGEALFGPKAGDSKLRLDALWRQVRYLMDGIDAIQSPQTRWNAAAALAAQSLTLRGGQTTEEAFSRLEGEVTAQILPDGGHVSRAPSRLMECLYHLLTLRAGLRARDMPAPDWIDKWISRMAAMTAFFQSGDGALAPFNDGEESRADCVNAALEHAGTLRRFSVAPKSGFQRIEKKGLRILLDCGEAPPRQFSEGAHAGALSFELSDGPARLVTSCGGSANVNVDWQAAVRRTSAHSTLCMAGRDSASFLINEDSRLLAVSGPDGISSKRLEEADEIWLDAQHGGYKAPYGLLHRRRLFVSGDGLALKGEDSLARPVSQAPTDERKPLPFDIRFHLHPSVTAMMARDAIRLMCDSGAVWRFKTSHAGARLERTIYLARGRVERPEQIVLSGFADSNSDGNSPPNCVRWAFIKELSS